MARGFHFRGISSRDFGIYFTSTDRQMLPAKRKNQIQIAGRDGLYYQGGDTYDLRQITIDCAFVADSVDNIAAHSRRVAAWLSQKGELEFEDEPGVFYTAEAVGGISLTRALRVGAFTLTFQCDPLAHSVERQEEGVFTKQNDEMTVTVRGTADTPCRIVLKNTGDTVIRSLRISRRKELQA